MFFRFHLPFHRTPDISLAPTPKPAHTNPTRAERTLRRILLLSLLIGSLTLSGCSYLLVKTPSEDYSPERAEQRPLCTSVAVAPVIDAALIGAGIGALATSSDSAGQFVLGAGLVGGGTAGAIYGGQKTSDCRQAKRKFRQAQKQAQNQTTPTVPSSPAKGDQSDPATPGADPAKADDSPSKQNSESQSETASPWTHLDKKLTVSLSLLNLGDIVYGLAESSRTGGANYSIGPTFEAMVEAELLPEVSVALFGGGGSAALFDLPTFSSYRLTRLRYGLQTVWYPVGTFEHGMQLGGLIQRTQAVGVSEFDTLPASYDDSALEPRVVASTTLAPLVGYKVTSLTGLTLVTQAGVGARLLQGGATSGSLHLDGPSEIRPFLLLNLNLGWSFPYP